jgi:predicted TPR repeat methyltransferase
LEDTIWGASYGSTVAVQAAFDRFGPEYHRAILATGVPAGAAGALRPYVAEDAPGIDLGCGSGVLGLALRACGWPGPLDGLDLSPGMLELARASGCYRHLWRANVLAPPEPGVAAGAPYDFVVTVGLIGDYVPYYVGLPYAVSLLRAEGVLAFAVERRSTPWRALEAALRDLGLSVLAETELAVPEAALAGQTYEFFVTRRAPSVGSGDRLAGPRRAGSVD